MKPAILENFDNRILAKEERSEQRKSESLKRLALESKCFETMIEHLSPLKSRGLIITGEDGGSYFSGSLVLTYKNKIFKVQLNENGTQFIFATYGYNPISVDDIGSFENYVLDWMLG
jgi:hypothetical protein